MSEGRVSKAIPDLAVGDVVWLLPYETLGPLRKGRVRRAYKALPKASVDVLDARGRRLFTVIARGPEEGTQWWRSEADALDAVRKIQRADLVRRRDVALHLVKNDALERLHSVRRMNEVTARRKADLAELDAALAALDAEVQS